MKNKTVKISVALHIWAVVCELYGCRCNKKVDKLGYQRLSRRRSVVVFRVTLIWKMGLEWISCYRCFNLAEPVGLDRVDAMCPKVLRAYDGMAHVWKSPHTCRGTQIWKVSRPRVLTHLPIIALHKKKTKVHRIRYNSDHFKFSK